MSQLSQDGLAGLMGGMPEEAQAQQAGNAAFANLPLKKAVVPSGAFKAQVGEHGPEFIVDIVRAINLWCDKYQSPPPEINRNDRYTMFVQELGGGANHNAAEALLFFNILSAENDALKKSTFPELCSADATDSTASI
jgi:hypothetical protein